MPKYMIEDPVYALLHSEIKLLGIFPKIKRIMSDTALVLKNGFRILRWQGPFGEIPVNIITEEEANRLIREVYNKIKL